MNFQLSRKAREKYQFSDSLFSFDKNVITVNYRASQTLAQKINQKRDLLHFPEQAVKAGQINAMGLIDEIFHHIFQLYQDYWQSVDLSGNRVMAQAVKYIESQIGEDQLAHTLTRYVEEFPSVRVSVRTPEEYVHGLTGQTPNKEIILEEIVLLWITNINPALKSYLDLFDESIVAKDTEYDQVVASLHKFFRQMPKFGPDDQSLIDMLRSPAIAVPNSLYGQLDYIREHWAGLLGNFLYRLLTSLDFLKEEEKLRFFGPGEIMVPVYQSDKYKFEPEKFSKDNEWMTRLVLVAKNIYVWLDQLSKKYKTSITRFDQIPDRELDDLAASGITGIWLIGVWERSKASARIKRMCGNPEALASAYSIFSYEIAQELGGDDALDVFRKQAWKRGIRLGSDMVPNHMGIDSEWVVDHPEWFISSEYSPFPGYSFTGVNLSDDPRVELRVEDHYYDRTDAAVVFQWIDRGNNDVRYIYHGNDGTSMPWNDTAQLNYLKSEVREKVIDTILSVGRKFPIIRFDAAMTLTKLHFHRLWYPEPGTGGDIPSRSEYGLTNESFDQVMPSEFWREVVDRAEKEAPDVLLLAEAFWLLEGYFVRTLGMHRVYNSAFMIMLRDEDNAKYRSVMKNTLAFEPEILRRFVNFMNNPDERTAVDQFGKGDKYFGICTLLATLPGLPMIGHGQIEGFSEKYGMEYRKAYLDEFPDYDFIERHKREIFPLLRKRYLFADVANFVLYDFETGYGTVNEDVIAYSNRYGDENALVVYHNRFASTQGWIRSSVRFPAKDTSGGRVFVQKYLMEGLDLTYGENRYVIFRDQNRNLEYIRPSVRVNEQGLFFHLDAYQIYLLTDFRIVIDTGKGSYRAIYEQIGDSGVNSIEKAIRQLNLRPVQEPFREIINQGYLTFLLHVIRHNVEIDDPDKFYTEVWRKVDGFLHGMKEMINEGYQVGAITEYVQNMVKLLLALSDPVMRSSVSPAWKKRNIEMLGQIIDGDDKEWLTVLLWVFLTKVGILSTYASSADDYTQQNCLNWMDEWGLWGIFEDTIKSMGYSDQEIHHMISCVQILVLNQDWYLECRSFTDVEILQHWLSQEVIQQFIGINRHNNILWFNAEHSHEFLKWMKCIAGLEILENEKNSQSEKMESVLVVDEVIRRIENCLNDSEYQIEKWLGCLEENRITEE